MLIITGPGRSGTSLLALFCKELGFDPGGTWHDPVDAGLEYPPVVRINNAFLDDIAATGTTDTAAPAQRDAIAALDYAVIKDPRFTYHSSIFRVWGAVRQDISVLVTYRRPEHTIASRKRRATDLMRGINKNRSGDDVRQELADTLEVLLDMQIPHRMILFPQMLERYDEVYTVLRDLGLEFDKEKGREIWGRIIRPDRVHFRPDDQSSKSTRRFGFWPGKK
jgi:hypothetical protein